MRVKYTVRAKVIQNKFCYTSNNFTSVISQVNASYIQNLSSSWDEFDIDIDTYFNVHSNRTILVRLVISTERN